MSIRVEHNGVSYFCETPEEAVALGRLLMPHVATGRPRPVAEPAPVNGDRPTVTSLVQRLREGPRRLLQIVVDAGGEIEHGNLFQALDVTPSAFGGFLAAITKECARLGIDQRLFFQRVERSRADGNYVLFRIPAGAMDQVQAGLHAQVEGR